MMENFTDEYIIEKVGKAIINLWNAYKKEKLFGGYNEEDAEMDEIERNGYGDLSVGVYLEEYFNRKTWELLYHICNAYSAQLNHYDVIHEWDNTYKCYTLTISPKYPDNDILVFVKDIKRQTEGEKDE